MDARGMKIQFDGWPTLFDETAVSVATGEVVGPILACVKTTPKAFRFQPAQKCGSQTASGQL